ncbi:MAG: hypothetical protein RQ753_08555, partial [Desulfurivibrionaceae bacterium]|nr:hypothetical protein [Desulfurivibrionaceae bacterium]
PERYGSYKLLFDKPPPKAVWPAGFRLKTCRNDGLFDAWIKPVYQQFLSLSTFGNRWTFVAWTEIIFTRLMPADDIINL